MISVIITTYKEPETIGVAIESFISQRKNISEIIVVAPDNETGAVVSDYKKRFHNLIWVKDKGIGKPAALNKAIKYVHGDIIVLSDGDVRVSKNSLSSIIRNFKDKKVGAVSGRVISINKKNSLFGFWAFILTQAFHSNRLKQTEKNKDIIASGYLYAIRTNLIEKIPRDILAEDAYVSLNVAKKGFHVVYEPKAEVFVKYPSNLVDWIKQKKRTASRAYQLRKYFHISNTSDFLEEILAGVKSMSLIQSIKEFFWFLFLGIMRLYIWFRVFFDFRLWKRSFSKNWQRVESTK